jgi:cobalt/nickel transport protein
MVNKRAIILLSLVAVIVIFPLALYNGKGENQGYFGGSDDQGPAYLESQGIHPWFNSLWVPPSPEIESLLFATQASIGAIIIGYVLGYYNGMAKARRRDELDKQTKRQANRLKKKMKNW